MGKRWTHKEKDGVIAMAKDGHTSTDIAAAFGVSRGAVMGVLKRAGIKLKTIPAKDLKCGPRCAWTPEEDAVLRRMTKIGASYKTIAAELPGRTPQAVNNRANKLGINTCPELRNRKTKKKPWTRKDDETLKSMKRIGYRDSSIARTLSRSEASISNRWHVIRPDKDRRSVATEYVEEKPKPVIDQRPIIRDAIAIQRGYRIPPDKERYLGELLKSGMPVRQAYEQAGGVRV